MKLFAFAGLLIVCLGVLLGVDPAEKKMVDKRQMINLNKDWQYAAFNGDDPQDLENYTAWEDINLPHTWNQWDAMDVIPGYRRDASWYQKTLKIKDEGLARYHLYFEGANITTDVYVNGQKVGRHVGGYVGFEIDITEYLRFDDLNTISIRVDNSYNPNVIPSQKADFFIYGGITRDLWLKVLPANFLSDLKISTPSVTHEVAQTKISAVLNEYDKGEKYQLRCKIIDPLGVVVARGQTSINSPNLSIDLPAVDRPALWSPDSPALYTCQTQLLVNGKVADTREDIFGYRFYHFEPHGAFFLNGKRLLLRGTHRHEEHAGYGAAMPNELHRQDIDQMKEMGVNFLRLGHYPQDPEIYRACDELGIIVWDELPWCRGGVGTATWQDNTQRLLKEQITQNYNHPSIFFWSLGNEIYWLPDFEDGDNEDRLNAFVKKLNSLAHDLDPYRQTAIRKYYAGADLVDVFSPSIWSGWYAGVYTNYRNTLTKNQEKYPRFLHMEYGGSSHVGRHTETPITGTGMLNDDDWAEVSNQVNVKNIAKEGDWTESYIVDLFDHYLSVTETQSDFAGNAQWAFKDFGTPLRPKNAIPYVNQKGLVDRAGKPKDAFYVFKSYWATEPFAYIESHSWTHRRGPKGKARNIPVFSNASTVELFHNGQSLGQKKKQVGELPAGGLHWDVYFVEGPNDLKAQAYLDDKLVASDTMTVHYDYQQVGRPDQIHLRYDQLSDGKLLVEATMLDDAGLRVYDYEEEVYFTLDGGGKLLRNYGTPTRSEIIQMANGRATIELEPAATGRAFIEVRNQDFKGSYLIIDFTDLGK